MKVLSPRGSMRLFIKQIMNFFSYSLRSLFVAFAITLRLLYKILYLPILIIRFQLVVRFVLGLCVKPFEEDAKHIVILDETLITGYHYYNLTLHTLNVKLHSKSVWVIRKLHRERKVK